MTTLITGGTSGLGKFLLKEYDIFDQEIISTFNKKKFIDDEKKIIWKNFDLYSDQTSTHDYFRSPKTLIHLVWDGLGQKNYNSDIHLKQVDYHYDFLKNLITQGLKNVIITGTCFEYGDYEGEITEQFIPKPTTKYAVAKNKLRLKLENLKSQYNFNLSWLRLFYVYGGNKEANNLWGNINKAIDLKSKYFDISEGSQLRDYLHIKEVAKYIKKISLINKDLGIVNICSNNPISIKELINKWINDYRWKIQIRSDMLSLESYVNKSFWGSNKKLNSILN